MKTTKAFLLFMLLISTLVGTVVAQTTVVGVSPGNTLTYAYSFSWQSTNPSATTPAQFSDLSNIQSIKIAIRDVTGSTINVDIIKVFKNGTEKAQNGNINVDTQLLELPYSVLIIRAGANPDEKIYPSGGHAVIGETQTRTYQIGQVETIKYGFEQTSDEGATETTNIYYNRANGAGVEYNFESEHASDGYTTTITESLVIESFVIPEFPSIALIVVLLVFVAIIMLICQKKLTTKTDRINRT